MADLTPPPSVCRPPRPQASASSQPQAEAGHGGPATLTLHSTRDRDLVAADAYLTDTALDDLWEWLTREVHDPQLISLVPQQLMFVKMVNAVRKPYVEHIRILEREWDMSTPTASALGGAAKPDLARGLGTDAQASASMYTPMASESRQTVSVSMEIYRKWLRMAAAKDETIEALRGEVEGAKRIQEQVEIDIIKPLRNRLERAKDWQRSIREKVLQAHKSYKESQAEKHETIRTLHGEVEGAEQGQIRDKVQRAKQSEAQVEKQVIVLRDEVERAKQKEAEVDNDEVEGPRDLLQRSAQREIKAEKKISDSPLDALQLPHPVRHSPSTKPPSFPGRSLPEEPRGTKRRNMEPEAATLAPAKAEFPEPSGLALVPTDDMSAPKRRGRGRPLGAKNNPKPKGWVPPRLRESNVPC